MVQCQAQMEELVLKRGAVPRSVLTAGLQEATDRNIAMAINEVSIQDWKKLVPEQEGHLTGLQQSTLQIGREVGKIL